MSEVAEEKLVGGINVRVKNRVKNVILLKMLSKLVMNTNCIEDLEFLNSWKTLLFYKIITSEK